MITVHDRHFKLYMPEAEILNEVSRVAMEISHDLKSLNPLFCPTLTGSFMFMADLAKALDFYAETCFVKYASYAGMQSTGTVRADLPFPAACRNRHVVIVEDIVDTGITMDAMLRAVEALQPASVHIATFLFKPGSFTKQFPIDYIGRSIANDFIVGYGMDYDGLGRFYRDIYVVDNSE